MALVKGPRRSGVAAKNARIALLSAAESAGLLEFPTTVTLPGRSETQYVVQPLDRRRRPTGEKRVLTGSEAEVWVVGQYDALAAVGDQRAEQLREAVQELTADADELPAAG